MELNIKLPGEIRALFEFAGGEEIRYCSPFDINSSGKYCDFSYGVLTNRRLLIIEEGQIVYEMQLSGLSAMKCESQVNNGILVVTEKESGLARHVARFSMKHISRFASIAKGGMLMLEGSDRIIENREYEKTCPKCGRALPGTRVCPKCEGKNVTLLKFVRLCTNYKKQFVMVALMMLFSSLVGLAGPMFQQRFIDNTLMSDHGSFQEVIRFTLIMAVITVLSIITRYLRSLWSAKLGAGISMDIRGRLYQKMQVLTLSFIQDRRPGELMNRINNDSANIRKFMEDAFGSIFYLIVLMTGAIIVMLTISPGLTLLSIVFLPLAVALSVGFRKVIHRKFHMQYSRGDDNNSALQDVISGIRVVKSFGKEKYESDRFKTISANYARIQKNNEVFWASFYPMLTFIMGMGIYFVTALGGLKTLDGGLSVGQLLQFTTYATMLYGPLGWMTHLPRMIVQMLTSLERIYDVLDEQPKIRNRENPVSRQIQGNVVFKDVSFGYRSYETVLEKINFEIKKGEMIGIVGASGTGKSTLINLVMHLYDVDDGELLIDGININDYRIEDFHRQLGVVLQETFLFSDTILNNMRFAKPDATYEEIIRAAKMANAHDFICKTPNGYNTYVGEKGYNLSGGERQRIAIARAILNDPKLLILDEATSSLDTESEYLIQKALQRLTAGRTTLAIAHRLSTLKDADRLIVIDGHKIAECGSHNELLEKKGIYYKLVTAQLQMQTLKEGEG